MAGNVQQRGCLQQVVVWLYMWCVVIHLMCCHTCCVVVHVMLCGHTCVVVLLYMWCCFVVHVMLCGRCCVVIHVLLCCCTCDVVLSYMWCCVVVQVMYGRTGDVGECWHVTPLCGFQLFLMSPTVVLLCTKQTDTGYVVPVTLGWFVGNFKMSVPHWKQEQWICP